MNMKRLILAGCSVIVFGVGTAWAGPCDMGRTNKDAGSGPASQSSSQTTDTKAVPARFESAGFPKG